jgi:chorismate mutase
MQNNVTPGPGHGPATAPSSLDVLRREIDSIDDALLDLIERRLAASLKVAAHKNAESDRWLKIRPRREARIVARLVERAGLASPELIARVWRALMSHSLQSQAPVQLVVYAPGNPDSVQEQVRERFGAAATILPVETPGEALAAAGLRDAIAVIEHDPRGGWWRALEPQAEVRIFGSTRSANGALGALLLGRVAPDEMPEDQCYCVIDEDTLRGRVAAGETIEAIAVSHDLRLCVAAMANEANEAKEPTR